MCWAWPHNLLRDWGRNSISAKPMLVSACACKTKSWHIKDIPFSGISQHSSQEKISLVGEGDWWASEIFSKTRQLLKTSVSNNTIALFWAYSIMTFVLIHHKGEKKLRVWFNVVQVVVRHGRLVWFPKAGSVRSTIALFAALRTIKLEQREPCWWCHILQL